MASAVACLALSCAASNAFASFPGKNGRIAYSPANSASLHTILPSGNGDQAIANQAYGFSWSPNGRRIALGAASGTQSDIYTMRADGSDVRRLTFNGSSAAPSYSPGGGRIAFGGPGGVTIMRNNGSAPHVIAPEAFVTWAPNGQIVFFVGRGGGQPASFWSMRPDGTSRHQLVALGPDGGFGPFYAPDGSKFLFWYYEGSGSAVGTVVRLADADGTHLRPPPCPGFFRRFVPTSYSPDGHWVLAAAPNYSQGGLITSYKLVRLRLATCMAHRVVSPTALTLHTDWQPLPSG